MVNTSRVVAQVVDSERKRWYDDKYATGCGHCLAWSQASGARISPQQRPIRERSAAGDGLALHELYGEGRMRGHPAVCGGRIQHV